MIAFNFYKQDKIFDTINKYVENDYFNFNIPEKSKRKNLFIFQNKELKNIKDLFLFVC